MKRIAIAILRNLLYAAVLSSCVVAFAHAQTGNIDPLNKWAWLSLIHI